MRLAATLFAVLVGLLIAQSTSAQSVYPNKPVKIIVGFPAGTAPDVASRIVADKIRRRPWAEPVGSSRRCLGCRRQHRLPTRVAKSPPRRLHTGDVWQRAR